MNKVLISFLSALFIFSQIVIASPEKLYQAGCFFSKYVQSCNTYDKKVTDMFAENALIKRILDCDNERNGEYAIIPVEKYKKKLRFYGPLAKLRKYRNDYKDLEFSIEGDKVRIKGTRLNNSGYTAPASFLIGLNDSGEWKIFEDITHTKSILLCR